MNKTLIVKLFFILIYLGFAVSYFYDEHFIPYTGSIYTYETLFIIIVSMSLGVILSAIIYNFSLYLYLKNTQYLYYSLAQLSALFFLISLDSLYISPFDEIFQLHSTLIFDISQLLMLFFSLLFLKSFFKSYNLKSINTITQVIIGILFIDLLCLLVFSHTYISKLIPLFIPILLVLSEAIEHVEKRDTAFNFIIIGWMIVLVTVALQYFGILALWHEEFPFFHIAIALESIFISLALAYKFKLITEEKATHQIILLQQSRLASMGEMLSSIAHQWRQPLNILALGLMNIKKRSKGQEKNLKTIEQLKEQLQYMSNTIEDFKHFYNPSKAKTNFSIHDTWKKASLIAFSSLEHNNIEISVELIKDFSLYGHQNELEQVILSIINNAKDAFLARNKQTPNIHISIDESTLSIHDNAGGIKKQHIDKIFKPYFSTKEKGEGIGLYISKLIVEKEFQGLLDVCSVENGTTFSLTFNHTSKAKQETSISH
jgi:signal transduction histidine kinase